MRIFVKPIGSIAESTMRFVRENLTYGPEYPEGIYGLFLDPEFAQAATIALVYDDGSVISWACAIRQLEHYELHAFTAEERRREGMATLGIVRLLKNLNATSARIGVHTTYLKSIVDELGYRSYYL